MLRMIWRLSPWAMMLFGVLMCLVSITTLFGEVEEKPTCMSISDVMLRQPEHDYLTITGGVLAWPQAFYTYRKIAGKEPPKTRYVPILDSENATEGLRAGHVHRNVVFVRFSDHQFATLFPGEADGTSTEEMRPFEPQGTLVPKMLYDKEFEKHIKSEWGLSTESVLILEQGVAPLQKGQAFGLGVFGMFVSAVGFYWIRNRHVSRKSTNTGISVVDAGGRGLSEGIEKAVRRSVKKGIAAAFHDCRHAENERGNHTD